MKRFRNPKGFTLIELLIVIVIIGILAIIAIPRLAPTRGKAYDAAAKSDLRNAMTAQEAYFTENQQYAGTPAELTDFSTSPNVTFSITAGDANGYEMTTKHASSDNTWCVNSGTGQMTKATDC